MGKGVNDIIEEVMKIYRSLPARPGIEEVEAAMAILKDVERTEQAKIEEIMKQQKPADVPEELFSVLKQMRRNLIVMQSMEERKEALAVLEVEKWYKLFDELLQRASGAVSDGRDGRPHDVGFPNGLAMGNGDDLLTKYGIQDNKGLEVGEFPKLSRDDSFLDKPNRKMGFDKTGLMQSDLKQVGSEALKVSFDAFKTHKSSSFGKQSTDAGEQDGKLSLIKLASVIEATAKKGATVLNLEEKLIDQVEWLPETIGKLTTLVELNLSNNRIVTLPNSIGGLTGLRKLDLHSNQLYSLCDSIGQLTCLIELDLHANSLRSLPASVGELSNLEILDLSSNQLSSLPESIGKLTKLKKLDVETNEIDELPYTIGFCASLTEIHADFNHLKALPEAIGKLTALEVLTLHYNKVRNLPTTMANLLNLKELDVSFNEVEAIPESLCFATNLVKLNVGRNFADLRHLPRNIGNLEMLEELDISSNQIKVLPESFAELKRLRVLRVDEVPLEVPPMEIAQMGAQAVVEYMVDFINKRDVKVEVVKPKSLMTRFLSCIKIWKSNSKEQQGSAQL